jgi:hypothetical protein
MNIHQVNSKETMLSENDIVIVASHMADSSEFKVDAKKHGVSPERLLYTMYIHEMRNPTLIRIRDGNTLFTIAALKDRYGFVSMYNGDTKKNIATNFNQFLQSAYKIGFNVLAVRCMDDSLNDSAEEVESSVKDAELAYDDKNDLLYVKFKQPHGD